MGFKQLSENIFGNQRSGNKGSVSIKSSGAICKHFLANKLTPQKGSFVTLLIDANS